MKLTKLEYYNMPYVYVLPKRAVNDVAMTITSDNGQCWNFSDENILCIQTERNCMQLSGLDSCKVLYTCCLCVFYVKENAY